MRTGLMRLFDLKLPVIQAPMAGGGDTAELVSAVSNAGGMGFIGAAYLTPEQILERGRQVRSQTSRPFGINLFAPLPMPERDVEAESKAIDRIAAYYAELGLPTPEAPAVPSLNFDDQLAACLETGAAAFSMAFGLLPPRTVREIKRRGLYTAGTATTVAEAQALVETGFDAVIAQGIEAGGHRGTFLTDFASGAVGLITLLPQVSDAVKVTVIAAGGIMDGRGIAASLMLGANGVQMGTAFLTCEEGGVSEAYKESIMAATEDQTAITRAFSGRPARGIKNRMLVEYETESTVVLPFPLQNSLTRPLRTEASRQGRAEFLSLWAGQGLRMARLTTAADLMLRLERELSTTFEAAGKLQAL